MELAVSTRAAEASRKVWLAKRRSHSVAPQTPARSARRQSHSTAQVAKRSLRSRLRKSRAEDAERREAHRGHGRKARPTHGHNTRTNNPKITTEHGARREQLKLQESPGSRRGATVQSRGKLPMTHTAPHKSSLRARSARGFRNLARRTPSGAKPAVATDAERDRLMGMIRRPNFPR